jgi:hypothetical protein
MISFKEYVLLEQLAKGKTLEDIATLHNVDLEELKKELLMGIGVEKEHTPSEKTASQIAMDHLTEYPRYYSKLKKIGL